MCGCVVHFGRGRGPLNLFFNGFHSALTTGQGQSSLRRSTVPDKRSYVHIICTKRPKEKIASTETSISQNSLTSNLSFFYVLAICCYILELVREKLARLQRETRIWWQEILLSAEQLGVFEDDGDLKFGPNIP